MSLQNNENKYRIETTRLQGWNYSKAGYYYITICTKNKKNLFGKIEKGQMILNEKGFIVKDTWENLKEHYKNIELHEFIIMPDHVHGIIEIKNVETGLKPISTLKKYSLSEIIRGFKTFLSRKINERFGVKGNRVWQERFYDRIIRNEREFIFIV